MGMRWRKSDEGKTSCEMRLGDLLYQGLKDHANPARAFIFIGWNPMGLNRHQHDAVSHNFDFHPVNSIWGLVLPSLRTDHTLIHPHVYIDR